MKVLVVDDVLTNRWLVSRVLEKRGHVVKAVESGTEAIDVLAHENFDLVVMDIHMPRMSGFEAAEIIRNRKFNDRNDRIVILATSASCFDDIRSKCVKAGMDDFIVKPINPAELLTLIEKYDQKNCLKYKTS